MKFKKTLTSIVFLGTLALSGCKDNREYHFNGKIGEEQVRFYERELGDENILRVTRANGIKVRYVDKDNDLKLDYVKITKEGETSKYINDVIGERILVQGQKQFDDYLAKIIKSKQTKGLNDISKE